MSHRASEYVKLNPASPPSDPIAARDYWLDRGQKADAYGHSWLDKLKDFGRVAVGVAVDPAGTLTKTPLSKKMEAAIDKTVSDTAMQAKDAIVEAVEPASDWLEGFAVGALKVVGVVLLIVLVAYLAFRFTVKKVENFA